MTKKNQSPIVSIEVIQLVLNLKFRSLIFVCDLCFGAWNFYVYNKSAICNIFVK